MIEEPAGFTVGIDATTWSFIDEQDRSDFMIILAHHMDEIARAAERFYGEVTDHEEWAIDNFLGQPIAYDFSVTKETEAGKCPAHPFMASAKTFKPDLDKIKALTGLSDEAFTKALRDGRFDDPTCMGNPVYSDTALARKVLRAHMASIGGDA